jgi:hypothetical protein
LPLAQDDEQLPASVVGDLREEQFRRMECGLNPSWILHPFWSVFLLAYRLIMHDGMGTAGLYIRDFAGFVVTGKCGYLITN